MTNLEKIAQDQGFYSVSIDDYANLVIRITNWIHERKIDFHQDMYYLGHVSGRDYFAFRDPDIAMMFKLAFV